MKILILSASAGAGHMRAAQAVECALREAHPEASVKVVDVLELASPLFRRAYGEGYLGLANSAPRAFGYLYDIFDRPGSAIPVRESARGFLQRLGMDAFPRFIEEEACDAVVNTHFLPAELLADLKARGEIDVPQMTVVTDFDAHRLWASRPCEQFFVASQEGAVSLIMHGVPTDAINVSGIPIHPVFARCPEREQCLKAHGLSGERPVVLQMAGGAGMGAIDDIWTELLAIEQPLELVVVAGRNQKAFERLKKIPVPARHRARVLGFTDKVHELMAAADLLVTKPGGLTTAEALSSALPVAAVMPIPGQESRNADFLLARGAGLRIDSPAALRGEVSALLRHPARLRAMRAKAFRLGRPLAAFEVARKAVELASAGEVFATSGVRAGF
ncbi:MAG TPA: glycosyltransferase [Elusimicrobiota bacterium]|nr:glycosyltransferase [Elusimicrobiota bacterium]